MTFAHPTLLWFIPVILPAMAVFFWWSWRKRQQLLNRFIASRLLPGLTVGISKRRQKISLLCQLLAVTCLLLALARPRWGFDWEEVRQRGLDIVVAIDTSKSMLAEDITPNRLARAKLAALDLMQQAKSDRLALVAFAGGAFLQCPLTIDDAAFRQSVEALDVNIIPQGGTALAEAIDTAVTAFKEGDNYKIMVLFTDGEDQDPGATKAAEKAAKSGMQIFTIGVGTAEGEILRMKDAKGRTDYLRDDQGNVVKSHLNETLLQQIAGATKGFYLPLRGAKTIDTLYQEGLAPLPKADSQQRLIKRYRERFHWPLAIGILLLLIDMLLPERKRQVQPERSQLSARSKLRPAVAGLLLLALPSTLWASSSSALRDYQAGKYAQALREYQKLLARKSDPRLEFNVGAAAYQNQQFEEALKRFNQALSSPDLKVQQEAYYNRANTLYQLGERNSDPGKRTEAWEKSLQDYQSTLKLNPADTDARFNYEFVKKRLEELKQQQQQQQKSQDNKDDKDKEDKDQKDKNQDQQQQQKQENSKNDQQQQQNQKDQSGQPQNPEQQKQQEAKKEPQPDQSQQQKEQAKKDAEQKQQEEAKQSAPENEENKADPAQAYATGQMTPQQAQQLLDAQKGEEKMLPVRPGKPVERTRPLRDW